jgi:hypothetical protein
MSVKAADLAGYLNKMVVVQVDTSEDDTDEDFEEVSGRLETVTEYGIVIKTKTGPVMRPISRLLDIEPDDSKPGKVIKRHLEPVDRPNARQHLADRHGWPVSLLGPLSPAAAIEAHSKIDHRDLGHGHEPKPQGRRERPPGS